MALCDLCVLFGFVTVYRHIFVTYSRTGINTPTIAKYITKTATQYTERSSGYTESESSPCYTFACKFHKKYLLN